VFHKNATLTATHEPLHAQNDETNGNIEFLQPYPVVAADALFEIGTAVILFGTYFSGYALLNASRTAANDFDEK
jgi:hypothetical protein